VKSDIKPTVLLDSRMAKARSEVKDSKLMLIDEADEDLEACEVPDKRRKKMDTEEDSSFAI